MVFLPRFIESNCITAIKLIKSVSSSLLEANLLVKDICA
ncbi:hypothetical protein PanWU01x14_030470 [Parasponia andersonii]|uniref:Uncharacterized protein n=1 Tax=Parasponia andersonii TaxID=3476 RepID=A0A2P5DUS3_PARAD|nr:hypothetical protein PanWU01x14_030470 [Parasponia andersonii]